MQDLSTVSHRAPRFKSPGGNGRVVAGRGDGRGPRAAKVAYGVRRTGAGRGLTPARGAQPTVTFEISTGVAGAPSVPPPLTPSAATARTSRSDFAEIVPNSV